MLVFPEPVKSPQYREGHAFRKSDLDKWVIAGGLESNMLDSRKKHTHVKEDNEEYYIMSDVNQAYDKANEIISNANEKYNQTLSKFRSQIKNDLTSISSSANRVVNEAAKMNTSYTDTIESLVSDDMEKAISNAERLATALEAISKIKPTDIKFKFLENKDG